MKINIDGVPYEFKDRLTIEEWKSIMQYNFNEPKQWPQIVSIVTGAPIYYLQKANEELLGLAIGLVIQKMDQRTKVSMRNLEALTFGEFIDLDVYLTLGIDTYIVKILEVLRVDTKWADEAMYVVEEYAKYRTFIYRQYKTLFGLDDKDFGEAEESDEPQDKMKVARDWYKVIVSLADWDITKMDAITDQPLKKVLNFMALQKEQRLEEERVKLEQQRQYDLQRNRR